jgi:transposase-like protein
MKLVYEPLSCKLCGSQNVIRFGCYHGIQRWWCKDCRHKFADNDALPNMRIPSCEVALAIGMYYEGRSLNTIPRLIRQLQLNSVTNTSVKRWVIYFSRLAVNEAKKAGVSVGDTWFTYERSFRIGGKNLWVIDVVDSDTWFLLATTFSYGRSIHDIRHIMEVARDTAGIVPKRVLTNNWRGYLGGIELAYGADVERTYNMPSGRKKNYLKLVECWQRILKDRDRIIHRLKDKEYAQVIFDGWMIHYNYFRINEALGGKTPAEAAKSNLNYHNWAEVVYQSLSKTDIMVKPEPPVSVNTPKTSATDNGKRHNDAQTDATSVCKSFSAYLDNMFSKDQPRNIETVEDHEIRAEELQQRAWQIILALNMVELGVPVAKVCHKMGIAKQTFYYWRKKYHGIRVIEIQRLKELEKENRKLKQLLADLNLDKQLTGIALKKNLCGAPQGFPT